MEREFNWNTYSQALSDGLNSVSSARIEQVVALISVVANENNTIWVFGNGGSAATASHFCVDLSKGSATRMGKQLKALPILDLVPLQTAFSNDISYESAIANSLRAFAKEGDLAFFISGSGNSENILSGVMGAKKMGLKTVALTGFQGGRLGPLVDLEINVKLSDMQLIEDVHHAICHFISKQL
jgi:D-sedoheptulose 7-phosphate isomerase